MTFSSKIAAKVPHWYHTDCFFKKVKLIDVNIIKGFDDLRWEDQDKIRHLLQENFTLASNGNDTNDTFSVQYAKSKRSTCHGCEASIDKDTIRLSRKNYTSRRARHYGPFDEWYHVDCFHQMKKDLGFFGTAESFFGFSDLNDEDQAALKEKFGTTVQSKRKRKGTQLSSESTKAKQAKTDDETVENFDEQEQTRRRKEHSEFLWALKDNLRKEIPAGVLKELLEFNVQKSVSGESNLIEAVADCMAFGALEPCPECGGFLVFNYTNYCCTGNITEWTKCSYTTNLPKRKAFQIPDKIKEDYDMFQQYKYEQRDRIIPQVANKPKLINKIDEIKEPDYDPKLPLNGYSVALIGRLSKRTSTLKKQIEQLGGTTTMNIDKTVDVVISTQDDINKGNPKIQNAQTLDIHVVPELFLNDILNDRPSIVMEKLKLSAWGTLPHIRKQQAREDKKIKRKSSFSTKSAAQSKRSIPEKVTMKLKDGAAVDPDSGLEETCHVLKDAGTSGIFIAVLGMVDITRGTNAYYKMQLLEDDDEAIDAFHKIFFDKTGNQWTDREKFKKFPNKYYPLEIDYGQHGDNEQIQKALSDPNTKISSHLPQSVQDLICLIFNVEQMEKTLLSFDIDLRKMPLGKLSRNQLKKAYGVLTELQTLITSDSINKTSIIDASNRFYTLVPHDFGRKKPQILDNADLIQSKTQMIDNLLDIEIAYSMLKGSSEGNNEHPIDVHYKKLKCPIESIEKNSEEFKRIEQYMINTHAATHNSYTLKLKELFRIAREGEDKCFEKWEQIKNRQLLWHGSRTTNFAGILSQGLRIAPPEAPMTGYMFGKGVYFADMVSKTNYCHVKSDAPEGLMLLCEVALGKMYECYKGTSLSADTLPKGTQSTKGCGQTTPDPKNHYYTDDGVLIPMGRGVRAAIQNMSWHGVQGFQVNPKARFIVPDQGDLGIVHTERGLTYVEVALCGHMVPQFQPQASLQILKYLLGRIASLTNEDLTTTTTSSNPTPDYDPKLPLNGYSVALIARLSKRTSTLKKYIEQLGGTTTTNIDKTVGMVISTQDEISKGNPKSIVMKKLKLSAWGTLPHI
ncbi:unnamed protein product [Rotaria sordida]|uniref:Poly [ADP-ribose] polymerase n=1 Tax=Rotaria sordida TaxID=392033 RepID=A0A814EAY7_9BILA|nr:unnamed protein product [Rotaria sordida]